MHAEEFVSFGRNLVNHMCVCLEMLVKEVQASQYLHIPIILECLGTRTHHGVELYHISSSLLFHC